MSLSAKKIAIYMGYTLIFTFPQQNEKVNLLHPEFYVCVYLFILYLKINDFLILHSFGMCVSQLAFVIIKVQSSYIVLITYLFNWQSAWV